MKLTQSMTSKIRFEIIYMTPERAKELLGHPQNKNRTQRKKWIDLLRQTCSAGEFILTHQGIMVGPTGILYDGQHRCRAIVESGTSQWVVVATFSTDSDASAAMFAVDRHAKRALGDVIELMGDLISDRGQDRVAVARMLHSIEHGAHVTTDAQIVDLVMTYREDYDAIRARMVRHLCNAAATAAFVWMRKIDPFKVDALAERLASKEGMTTTEATISKLLATSISGQQGAQLRIIRCFKLMRGIQAVLDGESITKLQEVQKRPEFIAKLQKRRQRSLERVA